jgi:predicted nucleic acid-binding Zn ribbon protein
MRRFSDRPEPLGDVLRNLASRVKKVDLNVIEEIRVIWPTLVEPVVAQMCQPEFVKNRVLVISVPSGAFAQQIALDQRTILEGLAPLKDRAPTSLKTVQKA